MSPAIIARTIPPSPSRATPARTSFLPFTFAKPTRVPAGASARNRSEEIRLMKSSELTAPTNCPVVASSAAENGDGSKDNPATSREARVTASRNSS
jgi:hypothetical protein